MKILILIPRMNSGGAERVAALLANRFVKKHEVQITTLISNDSFYELKKEILFTSADYKLTRNSKISRYLSMMLRFVPSILFIRKTIENFKPDIVISFLVEMDIICYISTVGKNVIRIFSERNDPTRRNSLLQKLMVEIYRRSDAFVCQTKQIFDYYNSISISKKFIIPNPVDIKAFPSKGDEAYPPIIVSVGRLSKQKNYKMMIDAFSKIEKKHPYTRLIIYGEGPERNELEQLIKDNSLEKRVFLLGNCKNVLLKLQNAAIFAFSSDYEGFPNALIEAVALGIPIVSTDFYSGAAKELIDDKIGILVARRDIDSFANALDYLLKNQEKRFEMRKYSGIKCIAKYDVGLVADKWEELFGLLYNNKAL